MTALKPCLDHLRNINTEANRVDTNYTPNQTVFHQAQMATEIRQRGRRAREKERWGGGVCLRLGGPVAWKAWYGGWVVGREKTGGSSPKTTIITWISPYKSDWGWGRHTHTHTHYEYKSFEISIK